MKQKVYTITRKQYAKALEAAGKAAEGIPAAHNRKRAHEYADTLKKQLWNVAKLQTIETEGRDYIYYTKKNLGSRKWSDYVDEFVEVFTDQRRENFKRVHNRIYIYR